MSKEFVVDYTDWHGRKDAFFCTAGSIEEAKSFAFWSLGDLIDIHEVSEWKA